MISCTHVWHFMTSIQQQERTVGWVDAEVDGAMWDALVSARRAVCLFLNLAPHFVKAVEASIRNVQELGIFCHQTQFTIVDTVRGACPYCDTTSCVSLLLINSDLSWHVQKNFMIHFENMPGLSPLWGKQFYHTRFECAIKSQNLIDASKIARAHTTCCIEWGLAMQVPGP